MSEPTPEPEDAADAQANADAQLSADTEPGQTSEAGQGTQPWQGTQPLQGTQPVQGTQPSQGTQPVQRMEEQLRVTTRRSPKYPPFILLGVLVGFVVAGIMAMLPIDTSQLSGDFSRGQAAGILMAILGIAGGFAGAIVVLILDRRSLRAARSSLVTAQYESEVIPPTREELVAQAKEQLAAEKAAKRRARGYRENPEPSQAPADTEEGTR